MVSPGHDFRAGNPRVCRGSVPLRQKRANMDPFRLFCRCFAGLPATFTLDACRHGGMTELEEAEPTDGQGRALSAHKSRAYEGYAKRTMERALAATRKRHAHRIAGAPNASGTEFQNGPQKPSQNGMEEQNGTSESPADINLVRGWGARIRTWEWRNQNPLPYRLATPQRQPRPRAMPRLRPIDARRVSHRTMRRSSGLRQAGPPRSFRKTPTRSPAAIERGRRAAAGGRPQGRHRSALRCAGQRSCPAWIDFPGYFWSEWQDLNLRPPRPERGALPDCATLRHRGRPAL